MKLNGNAASENTDIIEVKEFNLQKQKEEIAKKVENSPEINNILAQIDTDNMQTVVRFGNETVESISKFSDRILNNMEMAKIEDTGTLLNNLNKIMEKFDIKDFDEKKVGFFEKVFNKTKNSIEQLFKKYHTMGDEVEKVYISLKEYENEINGLNINLNEMFEENLKHYEKLEQYIHAGEFAVEELSTNIIPELERKAELGGNVEKMELSNIMQVREMMEQRVHDLKLAENIALQTMPSIKMLQYNNYNLIRKINSAFIITLPIFKQCLIQSIMLKRQDVQAKALTALDEKTNELLMRNAENLANQSKVTARLASGSFVDVQTLEKTWHTIVNGITETKQIQDEIREKRAIDNKKLDELKKEFNAKQLT
ncbi:toxic anion resistance protein [Clostridium sp. UBA6640]|uniref:toxic anion resistance protein n=1 Tax=Clostridium sp. UBA6640 TaxID=1946370 RepID=UPI0025C62ADC|nr:toxic anion resistance protein [Clostridium sp. UBA6640]